MSPEEESRLIVEMDKKLDVLINSVNKEVKSNDEFKAEVRKTTDSTQTRLREIEIWKSKMEVSQDDFKTIKVSIIRWVISGMLTSIVGGGLAAIIIKSI